MDTEADMDWIRQKIMTRVVRTPPDAPRLDGSWTCEIEDSSEIVGLPDDLGRSMDLVTGKVPRDEYVKANLASEMRRHRGRKRIRKKKAKRALRQRWGFLQMGRMLSRRINYTEIGKQVFTVEPLPDPVISHMWDINIADVVTGGEE